MNSFKNWGLEIDPSVYKYLKKIERRDSERILEVIKLLPLNPYFGDIQKMQGKEGAWRRRIGDYRVFYRIKTDDEVVLVFDLDRRTSKTYKKR